VDSSHNTVRGTEDDFHSHACRHCFVELRPRQRPILELPTAAPPASVEQRPGQCKSM
jgi:hypothetical protein